jgi:hypothetical protein
LPELLLAFTGKSFTALTLTSVTVGSTVVELAVAFCNGGTGDFIAVGAEMEALEEMLAVFDETLELFPVPAR